MTTANRILDIARAELGTKESPANSNNVKYNTAYYGHKVSGSAYPWCCAFVWWVFQQAGAASLFNGGNKTAYCPTAMSWYKERKQFSKIPRVGDVVFFCFSGNGSAGHIGIVEKVNNDGSIVSIEGNTSLTSNDNGGCVMRRTRAKSVILGYGHPAYAGATTTTTTGGVCKVDIAILKQGSKGNTVKALQILLNAYGFECGNADGDFGTKTLSAVLSFQQTKGLEVDGCVGADTWNKLLK